MQSGGGCGIRTHGTFRFFCFQDRRNKPLCQPSGNIAVYQGTFHGNAPLCIYKVRFPWLNQLGEPDRITIDMRKSPGPARAGRFAG